MSRCHDDEMEMWLYYFYDIQYHREKWYMVYSHCVCFGESISVTVVTWYRQLKLSVSNAVLFGIGVLYMTHPMALKFLILSCTHNCTSELRSLVWGFFRMSTVREGNYRFYHKVVVHLILSVCDMTKQTCLKIIPDDAITAGVPIIDRD